MKYILDANIFIEAYRRHYPFDVVLSFWHKLKNLVDNGDGVIGSIDKVGNELFSGNDTLKEWCDSNLCEGFFRNTIENQPTYVKIIQWANSNSSQYTRLAIDKFSDTNYADAWLVACAKDNNLTIVTYEVSAPNSKNNIKIPEPCNHFGVKHLNLIEMFRELKETF